jgi:hypothetical protein
MLAINQEIQNLKSSQPGIGNIYLHVLSDFCDDNTLSLQFGKSYYYNGLNDILTNVYKLSLIEFQTVYKSDTGFVSRKSFSDACYELSSDRVRYSKISTDNPFIDLNCITCDLQDDYKIEPENEYIDFYSPYERGVSQTTGECIINFDSIYRNNISSSVFIKFICTNNKSDELIKLSLDNYDNQDNQNSKILLASNNANYEVKSKKVLCCLTSNCSLADKNLYLYITDKQSTKTRRYRVNVVSILPPNISLWLILTYSIFIISITLMISLSSLIHIKKDDRNHNIFHLKYYGTIGIIFSFIIWYFFLLIIYLGWLSLIFPLLIVIIFTCVLKPFRVSLQQLSKTAPNVN